MHCVLWAKKVMEGGCGCNRHPFNSGTTSDHSAFLMCSKFSTTQTHHTRGTSRNNRLQSCQQEDGVARCQRSCLTEVLLCLSACAEQGLWVRDNGWSCNATPQCPSPKVPPF